MSTPDYESIESFEQTYRRESMQFTSSEWYKLPDYNNNSYNSGVIKFDTLTAKDQLVIYRDSYLLVPLTITSSTSTALTSGMGIAFKNSFLDIITSLQVQTASGQQIINDTGINYINYLRLLTQTTNEAMRSSYNDIGFYKNMSYPQTTSALTASTSIWNAGLPLVATNDPSPYVMTSGAAPIASVNPNYNEGFDWRIRLFKSDCTFSATAGGTGIPGFNINLYIPLSRLHPLFDKLDFPIINARFFFNFFTPIMNSTVPIVADSPILHATGVPDVLVNIGGSGSSCQLVYRKVTYSPEQNARVADLIANGHRIVLEMPLSNLYSSISNSTSVTSSVSKTDLVSSSTVAPLRVWQLVMRAGYVSGALANMQTIPFTTNGGVLSGNILINNQLYYQNTLNTKEDFWHILQQNIINYGVSPVVGSTISFYDFQTNYRIQLYDISRLASRLNNPAEAVNIQVQYTLPAGPLPDGTSSCDVIYIVERNIVVEFLFSAGTVSVAIGSSSGVV